tara:strand:+ start:350 stop:940 length:591 start_codon:yes stop_codon:yes gene_type:complete
MTCPPVLIIFVRAPFLGRVKQRLAAGIGQIEARKFYLKTSRDLIKKVSSSPFWTTVLCVTPDAASLKGRFWKKIPVRLPQGTGNLGQRMERVSLKFPNNPVLIIGSDIPDISNRIIKNAFTAVRRHDLVFGPSPDGGYWLVGARAGLLVRGLFSNVRWSTAFALSDTLNNSGMKRVVFVDTLNDIDSVEDFVRRSI